VSRYHNESWFAHTQREEIMIRKGQKGKLLRLPASNG
jgi:hypothetical protein